MDFGIGAALALVGSLWSGPADPNADLTAFVTALYAPQPAQTLAADQVYSDRLQALMQAHRDGAHVTAVATAEQPPAELVDFNPLENAHGGDVTIGAPVVTGDRALVPVATTAADGSTQLSLSLVHQQNGWRVDDVASFGSDGRQWLLSWLLQYDPAAAD